MIKYKIDKRNLILALIWLAIMFVLAWYAFCTSNTIGKISFITITLTLLVTWLVVSTAAFFFFERQLAKMRKKYGANLVVLYTLNHTMTPVDIFRITGSKVDSKVEHKLRKQLTLQIAMWLGIYALTGFFVAIPAAIVLVQELI